MNGKRTWGACLAAAAALVGSGCEQAPGPTPTPAAPPRQMVQPAWPVPEVPVAHIVRRDYRIREGDVLEVIYHVRHIENLEYRIKIEDVIEIRFPFNSDLDQIERVQSDGYLYLDLVGRVQVLRKTISEVRDELVTRYAKYVKEPVLTVSFRESNVKIAELKKAITTSPRGQSRLVPVTPDGTVSVPFIVSIRAAGKTIEVLHRDLNAAYMAIGLEELEVTVNLQTVAPMQVYVLGEVRIPGVLLNKTGLVTSTSELTLIQAIAQAGSYIPGRAELSKVMLVRRRHLARPAAAIVNVFQLLENRKRIGAAAVTADMSKHKYDIWLENGDIIYVPTTEIAKRADYIDIVWNKSIRNVLGFTSRYTGGDSGDWLGPN